MLIRFMTSFYISLRDFFFCRVDSSCEGFGFFLVFLFYCVFVFGVRITALLYVSFVSWLVEPTILVNFLNLVFAFVGLMIVIILYFEP